MFTVNNNNSRTTFIQITFDLLIQLKKTVKINFAKIKAV